MKNFRIIQVALLTAIVFVAINCSPSREYYSDRYPSTRASVSLIINSWPGIRLSSYPDGRYYYRDPDGYVYWRGYDNRYYLDRRYIGKAKYNRGEYNDWRDYDRREDKRNHRHH